MVSTTTKMKAIRAAKPIIRELVKAVTALTRMA